MAHQNLIDYVRSHIDPQDYYNQIFDDISWAHSDDPRVKCCFHEDGTASLHLNKHNGKWFCHGCEAGGKSIVSFESFLNKNSHEEAALTLFEQFIHPIIPDKKVRAWHRRLMKTPTALRYLTQKRRISKAVLQEYKIGFDGESFMIPIENEFGIYVNAKVYSPKPKHGMPKMLNYSVDKRVESRPFGKPVTIFPMQVLKKVQESQDDDTVLFVDEGEWDTLAHLSLGLYAVTSTGGSKSWPISMSDQFNNLNVCIAYDNDSSGQKHYVRPVRAIHKNVRSCKKINIPKKYGKDVSDWICNAPAMRKKESWLRRVARAKPILENPESAIPTSEVSDVTLHDSSSSEWYKKPVRVKALVTGKDASPYFVPTEFRVTCAKTCDDCPLKETDNEYKTAKLEPSDPDVLKMIDVAEASQTKMMINKAGFGHAAPSCQCKAEILKTMNVQQLLVIPTLDDTTGGYTIQPVYYTGHGIASNRAYAFSGQPLSHPKDQHSTCLFNTAVPVQDAIDTFELTPELVKKLSVFRNGKKDLMSHFKEFAEWQSENITHIRERFDLHIAIDLVFHSVNSFQFNGEFIKRGMLDVLILGDTRCGKGYVSEGLINYYGLGEIASGENCSFAGLIGGLQQSGNRWFVTWGLLPLNHNRFCVIDEASALSKSDIGKMSRVRSEGIAEISKIVREVTQANTRLVWNSNTRSGEPLKNYSSGAEAIKELIGANEDISRFDYALTVASDEVDSKIINVVQTDQAKPKNMSADRFPSELCKSLVLWTWSRSPEQVKFTPAATKAIIKHSIKLGEIYSPTIPLVQAENIRVKLAKISAAVAARVFSTDKAGEKLVINASHVRCACQLLEMFYSKESMRYNSYSEAALKVSRLTETEPIESLFKILGSDGPHLIEGLLTTREVSIDSVADYVGDTQTARMVVGDLVKIKCLVRQGHNRYSKNPAFIDWLRSQKEKR